VNTSQTVSIHEAKTHLSKLIQKALEGEEIIIAKRSEPLVKLQVIKKDEPALRFGGLKHLQMTMGDSFDEPLDDFADYGPAGAQKVADDESGYKLSK
jgi:prevent-host-death family protein